MGGVVDEGHREEQRNVTHVYENAPGNLITLFTNLC